MIDVQPSLRSRINPASSRLQGFLGKALQSAEKASLTLRP
jgi:hypothetical protein